MPPLSPISRETADQAGLMARCVSDSSLRRTSLHLDLDPSSSSPTSLLPTSPTSLLPSFTPLQQFKKELRAGTGRVGGAARQRRSMIAPPISPVLARCSSPLASPSLDQSPGSAVTKLQLNKNNKKAYKRSTFLRWPGIPGVRVQLGGGSGGRVAAPGGGRPPVERGLAAEQLGVRDHAGQQRRVQPGQQPGAAQWSPPPGGALQRTLRIQRVRVQPESAGAGGRHRGQAVPVLETKVQITEVSALHIFVVSN